MRKLLSLTGAALLSGLLVAPAMAGDGAPTGAEAVPQSEEQGAPQAEVALPGTVPQAQVDIVKQREEAKKRRDELLKLRAQTIQAGE